MHICHIAHNYFPGIGLAAMYEFCLQEVKLGYKVTAIVLDKSITNIEEDEIEGVFLYKIPSDTISAQSLKKFSFILKSVKILRKLNCDIVHVYSNIGFGLLPFLVGSNNKKWIYDIRSGPVHPGLLGRVGIVLLRVEALFFDKVTAGSIGTKNLVFGKNEKSIPIFSVGVNLDRFKKSVNLSIRQKYNIKSNQIILIFTGTLHKTRKLSVIIQTMRKIKDHFDKKIVLLLVGDGPDRENLINLSKILCVEEIVIFTGAIPYSLIPEYLSIADIGLAYVPNTREYGPQPGLKTAEMLACGLPVVSTDTEGNRLFVKSGYNGEVSKDEAGALAKTVIDLVYDTKKCEKYKLTSRLSVEEFAYENIVKNIIIPTYNSMFL